MLQIPSGQRSARCLCSRPFSILVGPLHLSSRRYHRTNNPVVSKDAFQDAFRSMFCKHRIARTHLPMHIPPVAAWMAH